MGDAGDDDEDSDDGEHDFPDAYVQSSTLPVVQYL
tara:strand:+ start:899 stop:1003 length:105 start_codon:yes stop_codon:yes gene_type:complete